MKLAQWLEQQGITAYAFARTLNLKNPATVYRYISRNNDRIPDRMMMLKICQETGGEVRADDFYDLPFSKSKPDGRAEGKKKDVRS